ncbi:hypothetical protein BU26DRAFT_137709 [Trematosphaeria pertusa]|uniref:DUF7924 domain-containing protein n=1 Tax=Trematosphaeria pertusa TaxID=390896 RepID=A0A6A6IXQ3_9PLEO|nr:uncharacterized protein BU26DRAFT_137709 [Trematosphaeria pertusa]KAF2254410.1 hypothetical protein BU26DRAFT_137709 [Trematosphaeria pertusa]
MRRDAEPPNPMKHSRKRAREHDSESPRRHRRPRFGAAPPAPPPAQPEAPSPPTLAPTTASSKHVNPSSSQRPQTPFEAEPNARKQPSKAQSEPKRSKRALDDPDCDQSATKRRRRSPPASEPRVAEPRAAEPQGTWFLNHWLEITPQSRVVQEKVEGSGVIPTIAELPELEAGRDQMSQQDAESTQAPGSAVSERLKTSSPMYRGSLKMNGIVIDKFGTEIPRDVEELVTKHVRKARTSPPLGEDKKASIRRKIEEVWDSPEPTVSDIITAPLFNLAHPALAPGRDILWSSKPLPRSTDYPLVTPKTDRHLGFQPTLRSEWTRAELAVADHPKVRPYSQPTRENLFPSFLFELKSEATGGTLYGAKGQLATAGFHRVSSLMWILEQIDPNRTQSSCDAIVFSIAICQREAVAHVHYYNPKDQTFHMSYIDSFYFAKDVQGCHDYAQNVVDWLLETQQPIVRTH